jgi:hypothetical protein
VIFCKHADWISHMKRARIFSYAYRESSSDGGGSKQQLLCSSTLREQNKKCGFVSKMEMVARSEVKRLTLLAMGLSEVSTGSHLKL